MKKDDFLMMTTIISTLVEELGVNPEDLLNDEQTEKFFEIGKKYETMKDEVLKPELLRIFEKLKKKLK